MTLTTKLLDREIAMSTVTGDLVLVRFEGSSITFAVCEARHLHYVGMDIDYAKDITECLRGGDIQSHKVTDLDGD